MINKENGKYEKQRETRTYMSITQCMQEEDPLARCWSFQAQSEYQQLHQPAEQTREKAKTKTKIDSNVITTFDLCKWIKKFLFEEKDSTIGDDENVVKHYFWLLASKYMLV